MTATFDTSLTSSRDHVRTILGDTDVSDAPMLQDETIDAALTAYGWRAGLSFLANMLVSTYSQRPDSFSESGGASVSWTERIKTWRDVADKARNGAYPDPSARRTTRSRIAVQQLTVQSAEIGDVDTVAYKFPRGNVP